MQNYCNSCERDYKHDWYIANKTKVNRRCLDSHLLRTYGLTPEDKLSLLEAQDFKCAICNDLLVESRRTHVDHNHVTGKNRKILCQSCNHGLGNFKDNPEVLRKAAQYIEEHNN